MRNLYLIIFSFVFFGCCSAQKMKKNERSDKGDFKKFILCQCLYNGIPIRNELLRAEGSAGMYVQKGSYDVEYYEKAIDFIKDYLGKSKSKYKSKTGANLTIAKCIDLYESEELEDFIKSLTNDKN